MKRERHGSGSKPIGEFFYHDSAEISKPVTRFVTFECGADKSQSIGSYP